ncbi:MAG: hypothetical protein RLY31_261 [Bacteroidota bacterium]|jgi:hypothetical protein
MFGLFKKDPVKALEKAYARKLEEARDTQRAGDIKGYARLMEEAEAMARQLESLKSSGRS